MSQVRLNPTTVQNVVTYAAIIDAPNPALKLKPGMTANVTIEVARRDDVLRVPAAALRFKPTAEALHNRRCRNAGGEGSDRVGLDWQKSAGLREDGAATPHTEMIGARWWKGRRRHPMRPLPRQAPLVPGRVRPATR